MIVLRNSMCFVYPFVCKNKPSVKPSISIYIPLIGKKYPFIEIKRNNHTNSWNTCTGFTLIELVVTMTVAAILLTVAVPSLRTAIQNGRITTQVNDLIADFSYARSEAIKRRENVVVCQSTNGTSCTGGNWKDGRLIFVDTNKDGLLGAEPILRFREAVGGSDSTFTVTGIAPVFLASGITTGAGNFVFCDGRGATRGKTVTLNATGQATVSQIAPATC